MKKNKQKRKSVKKPNNTPGTSKSSKPKANVEPQYDSDFEEPESNHLELIKIWTDPDTTMADVLEGLHADSHLFYLLRYGYNKYGPVGFIPFYLRQVVQHCPFWRHGKPVSVLERIREKKRKAKERKPKQKPTRINPVRWCTRLAKQQHMAVP